PDERLERRPRLGVHATAAAAEVADEWRDAWLLGLRQPDEEVETERPRDLLGEEGAQRPTVDPTDDLADEVPVRHLVVAVRRPRLPQRRLARLRLDDRLPREHLVEGELLVDPRQPRLVRQQVRDGDRLLAPLCELGPVPGNRGVDVEAAGL